MHISLEEEALQSQRRREAYMNEKTARINVDDAAVSEVSLGLPVGWVIVVVPQADRRTALCSHWP